MKFQLFPLAGIATANTKIAKATATATTTTATMTSAAAAAVITTTTTKALTPTSDKLTMQEQQPEQQQQQEQYKRPQQQQQKALWQIKRKHTMPEIFSLLIVAIVGTTTIWLQQQHNILKSPIGSCHAYTAPMAEHMHHTDDGIDEDSYAHHMGDQHGIALHHDMIGESEEHDHIAHHLAEMQNHEELLEDIREDTAVNVIPDKDLPKFGEPLQNVTVPVGREAVLQCVVDNLQTYKIAWLRVDTQTILTIQNHVITKNHRMSITHAEKRAWILRIRDVKESDKGWYMCQINTDPMKSQVGYLDVVVPPDILDYPTSTDMVIREGSNVTLKCAATGSPTPTITWRREGGELVPLPNGAEAFAYNGSFLTISKVNRLNMGAYLCIASNGIPPTVSKRVMLIVHFPPMIWIQNQLVGAAIGQNITLECQSEAYPKSINYWMKNDTIIVPGERFVPETFESGYKITMRLTINDVDILDFGSYRCVAKNSLGDTDGAIKLYHIPQTTTVTTVAPTPALNTVPVVITKNNKEQRYNANKVQRTKSKSEMPPSSLNNVFATSSLYNSQGHTAQTGSREHYHQSPDHSNYRADSKTHSKHHDAKSLTNDIDELHNLSSGGAATSSTGIWYLGVSLVIVNRLKLMQSV